MTQKGLCAVSGTRLNTGVLDHTHEGGEGWEGRVRGVLLSEVNMLEGRYLKLFNKLKMKQKYGIDFPDFLISLGTYLKQDNSGKPLHFKYMDDKRKQIKRLRKQELVNKLETDFNIHVDGSFLVKDLVQLYMREWVKGIENS